MSDGVTRQSIVDEEHLKLLSLGYMISAAISAFFSLFGLFYVFMGIVMGAWISQQPNITTKTNQPPPAFVGWLFAGIGLLFMLVLITLALLKLRVASCLKRRNSRTFCMVIAAIICLDFPTAPRSVSPHSSSSAAIRSPAYSIRESLPNPPLDLDFSTRHRMRWVNSNR